MSVNGGVAMQIFRFATIAAISAVMLIFANQAKAVTYPMRFDFFDTATTENGDIITGATDVSKKNDPSVTIGPDFTFAFPANQPNKASNETAKWIVGLDRVQLPAEPFVIGAALIEQPTPTDRSPLVVGHLPKFGDNVQISDIVTVRWTGTDGGTSGGLTITLVSDPTSFLEDPTDQFSSVSPVASCIGVDTSKNPNLIQCATYEVGGLMDVTNLLASNQGTQPLVNGLELSNFLQVRVESP